jgi:tRNA-dihydrouridine synthase
MAGLRQHLELIRKFDNPASILPRIKNIAGRYFKGIHYGSAIRLQIYQAGSFDEIVQLIDNPCSSEPNNQV